MRLGALRQWGCARSRIQAEGGRAACRAETTLIVCSFSAAIGFRPDTHVDILCEAQRQCPGTQVGLQVAAILSRTRLQYQVHL
jgi:hypothetical protein